MKKIFFVLALVLALVSSTSVYAAPECHNFQSNLFYEQDHFLKSIIAWADRAGDRNESDQYKKVLNQIKSDTTALQEILMFEGYTVVASEKNEKNIKNSTAAALVLFQKAHGLSQVGYADETTVKYFNQKYGCIAKATVNLTEPNSKFIKAKGEKVTIKWNATKIPDEATLNIQYLNTSTNATTTISTVTVKNGKGSYDWTIPSTIAVGNYKILLSLSGVVKSDVSALPFEIRENILEVTLPTSLQTVDSGSKVTIGWKTSGLIKSGDKLKISLVGVSGDLQNKTVDIATVSNTGSYTWTVPERFNGNLLTSSSTFKVKIDSVSGSYTTTSAELIKVNVLPLPSVKVLSPNGSESKKGATLSIAWESHNLDSLAKSIEISLTQRKGDALALGVIKSGISTKVTTFTYTLPPVKTPNLGSIRGLGTDTTALYKVNIKVFDGDGKILAQDSSDNEFTIVR